MWEYWEERELSETVAEYVEQTPTVTAFCLSAEGAHRIEEICRELRSQSEIIETLRNANQLFVRFCNADKYGVTCCEAGKVLECLQKMANGTQQSVFGCSTDESMGRVVSVSIWIGKKQNK